MHKSNIEFNSVSTYTNKTDNTNTLLDTTSVDLFDQNGYHLTPEKFKNVIWSN